MKIRICKHGPDGRDAMISRILQQYPDANIKAKGCLKRCKLCKDSAFAVIDKTDLLTAPSWDDLYELIIKKIGLT